MDSLKISTYLKSPLKGSGKCKKCLKKVQWTRERVAMHIRNCENSTDEEKKMFPTPSKASISHTNTIIRVSAQGESSSTQSLQLDNNVADGFKQAVANFIFKSGVSFRIVELDCFKDMFSVINPSLVNAIPNRKQLSIQLLDKEYDIIQEKLQLILANNKNLSLISDGWTNISGDHIVNYCIKCPLMPTLFYKSINTSGTSQTSEEIARQISTILETLGSEKFVSVVTDNASNMRAAWNLIERSYPHISCNGCSAHMINLLIKDILELEPNNNIIKECQKIIKYVNNHDFVNAKYEEIRKELNVTQKLSKSVNTHSKYVLIKLVDTYKNELKEINPKDNSKEVIKLIERNVFWEKATKLASVIEYPTNIIGKLEADDAKLNMVYHYFGKLYNHFQHDRTIQRFVKNRWDFILTESMEAAYMLTPKYCIDGFYIDNDKLEIIEHIRKIVEVLAPNSAEKVDDEFAKFINMISNLSQNKKEMIYQMDPKAYWNAFGKSQFPTLYICANYVYDMVASSAAAERVWSSFGFIHTKLRNRLSSNRVDKLISIYVNNALISKLDNFEDIFNDFAFYDEDNI